MNIARILYPVKVLGPGNRIGLWLCGCEHGCPGCSNPELWAKRPEYELPVKNVAGLIEKFAPDHPDGLTVSGGEPFMQAKELADLIETTGFSDVIIYTGYYLSELTAMHDPDIDRLLALAAVVIDGPYLRELNDGSLIRGSSNQTVHILKEEYRPCYERYFSEASNRIQNFTTADGVVSVGIHRADFREDLTKKL